jgi:hypothetical protein
MSAGMKLTDAERDTILAALRFWQSALARRPVAFSTLMEIAERRGPAVTADAIDDLCERINAENDR